MHVSVHMHVQGVPHHVMEGHQKLVGQWAVGRTVGVFLHVPVAALAGVFCQRGLKHVDRC